MDVAKNDFIIAKLHVVFWVEDTLSRSLNEIKRFSIMNGIFLLYFRARIWKRNIPKLTFFYFLFTLFGIVGLSSTRIKKPQNECFEINNL